MCGELTLPQETDFGDIQVLCDAYWECLANYLHALPEHDAYEHAKFDTGESGELDEPLPPVALKVFETFRASVAIIEFNYFDQDFRSEFGAVHETIFTAVSPDVVRVHFFDGPPPQQLTLMRDYVVAARDRYRGYVIVRPQIPTSIGRSMLAPPRVQGPLRRELTVADRTRTAVIENVNLFGVPLEVHGVPFMEQDGHLLRCAHVVTWMAHYTAVLKGVVARTASGYLNKVTTSAPSVGRPYPSPGASDFGFSRLLAHTGLPPEHISGARFGAARPLEWYDNKSFLDEVTQATADSAAGLADAQARLDRLWATNNLTGTLCRYLNSGIPCVFNDGGHSVLICGYFRERDREGGDASVSAVAGFFAQDDQNGPFRVLETEEMVEAALHNPSRTSVIIPLPKGLWLSGQRAESAGAHLFRGLVLRAHARLANQTIENGTESQGSEQAQPPAGRATQPAGTPLPADRQPVPSPGSASNAPVEDLADLYGALSKQVASRASASGLTIRSYAMEGSDFKIDFADRVRDENAGRLVGYVPLPKYVWVVEVLDRNLHRAGKSPVIATIVLDGSASSHDSSRQPVPLIAHLPGQISRLIQGDDDEEVWLPTSTDAYRSGRWTGSADGYHLSAVARSHRGKSARN